MPLVDRKRKEYKINKISQITAKVTRFVSLLRDKTNINRKIHDSLNFSTFFSRHQAESCGKSKTKCVYTFTMQKGRRGRDKPLPGQQKHNLTESLWNISFPLILSPFSFSQEPNTNKAKSETKSQKHIKEINK